MDVSRKPSQVLGGDSIYEGKVVVVTGAANGIGCALATRFAERGAAGVVIADLDGDGAVAVAERIGGLGVLCDVGDPESIKGLVSATERRFGPIDVFCSNAGGSPCATTTTRSSRHSNSTPTSNHVHNSSISCKRSNQHTSEDGKHGRGSRPPPHGCQVPAQQICSTPSLLACPPQPSSPPRHPNRHRRHRLAFPTSRTPRPRRTTPNLHAVRRPHPSTTWPLPARRHRVLNLLEGRGRSMIDLVANHLNATIETNDEA